MRPRRRMGETPPPPLLAGRRRPKGRSSRQEALLQCAVFGSRSFLRGHIPSTRNNNPVSPTAFYIPLSGKSIVLCSWALTFLLHPDVRTAFSCPLSKFHSDPMSIDCPQRAESTTLYRETRARKLGKAQHHYYTWLKARYLYVVYYVLQRRVLALYLSDGIAE